MTPLAIADGTVVAGSLGDYADGTAFHDAIVTLLDESEPGLDDFARDLRAIELAMRTHIAYLRGTKGTARTITKAEGVLTDLPRVEKARRWLRNPDNHTHPEFRESELWLFKFFTTLLAVHAELHRLRWPPAEQAVIVW